MKEHLNNRTNKDLRKKLQMEQHNPTKTRGNHTVNYYVVGMIVINFRSSECKSNHTVNYYVVGMLVINFRSSECKIIIIVRLRMKEHLNNRTNKDLRKKLQMEQHNPTKIRGDVRCSCSTHGTCRATRCWDARYQF
jgi:hypothetical protein